MQKLMKWAAFIGGTFIAAALGLVIYLGMNRVVVIADTGSASEAAEFSGTDSLDDLSGTAVLLQKSKTDGTSFRIPVEAEIGPDNISVENQYTGRMISIFLRGATGAFYKRSAITGYTDAIRDASYVVQAEGVRLNIRFSELYEYESIWETGSLQFNLYKPAERYNRVVVLDVVPQEPVSSEEREILYQIEAKLNSRLQQEGIKVYSTSERGNSLSLEEKLAFIEETGAGMYLGLTLGADEDKEQFGSYVCYNGTYFRPGLTNGTMADIIEREVVTEISGKARGLVDTDEGILGELSIPAAIVCPGYVTHGTERELLMQDGYQELIAEGICQGALAVFEQAP